MALMKTILSLAAVVCIGAPGLGLGADQESSSLSRGSPEAQGVSSRALLAFVDAADRDIDAMHSVMIVRHGRVVAEGWWSPYDAESPHALFSLSKSFTSTAVGMAVAEGKLGVDDEVLKFFPEDAPEKPSDRLKAMRVSDLLRMSTGHQAEPRLMTAKEPWTKVFLQQPVTFKPGSHFLYNTPATYMLSAIVQKVTGQTVLDYLRPRLFDPLGVDNPTWGTSPQGISLGGYGLSVRTEDIAKFGQLYLQKGLWQGKPLVPASWVEKATSLQTSNGSNPKSDWDQGYGYQFWRSRHGAYRGDGAFGQFCIVLPEQDAVVAITSGVKDMQAVLNLVWDRLLPALGPRPIDADAEGEKALRGRLAGLTMRPQQGSQPGEAAAKAAGKTFVFPTNPQKIKAVTLEADGKEEEATLVVRPTEGEPQRITCPRGEWRKSKLAIGTFPSQPAAASGAWTAEDTFTAKVCLYETPFILTLGLKFKDNQLLLDYAANVGFGPTQQPQLVGKAE
jgi:CubicO group peptidase (beta-lactamase class C family)